MLKQEIKQKIQEIRNKFLLEAKYPNDDYKLLNKFFNDIYTDPSDVIFLAFDNNEEHTYFSFSASIINPTYSLYSTVPFWYYCEQFSEMNLNVFICPNSFRLPFKRKNCIHGTSCLFVDIDDHDVDFLGMDKNEIKEYLNINYPLTKKIMPAWVSKSGHGLHLYFVTERYNFYDDDKKQIDDYIVNYRNRLEKSLVTYFRGDVKCLDLPREMRLPFSFNCKKEKIQTILYNYEQNQFLAYEDMNIYLLDDEDVDLYFKTQNHLKHSKNKNASVRNTKIESKPVIKFTSLDVINYYFKHKIYKTKSSTYNIILDLEDYYNCRKGFEGFRNTFYFIYAVKLKQYGLNEEEALKRCFDLNNDNDFNNEIEYIVHYQYENNYKITNIKIHELLQFTELEINCFRCAYTEERKLLDKKKRLKKLSNKRKIERGFKNNKQLQIDIIKNNPELSRAELSNILGCSLSTISRIKRELKKVS